MITPRIVVAEEKKLIGTRMSMSLADNKTALLWKNFIPRRREIKNAMDESLISMQLYAPHHFTQFSPLNLFEKWATVEVENFTELPDGMETFVLPRGLYAVFHYKGLSSDNRIFQYIFGEWLPASIYALDDRPHFEVLGEKYRNNNPDSEEEIWIPVRKKV